MKRILSFLMFCASVAATAQFTYNSTANVELPALNAINIVNASNPHSGVITSVQISATKVSGAANASDLGLYLTPDSQFVAGGPLLVGGTNTIIGATQYAAYSTVSGNNVTTNYTLVTPVTVTQTTVFRLMNTSATAAGAWSNVSVTVNGVSPINFDAPTYCANLALPANGDHITTNTVTLSWGIALGVTPTHTGFNVYLGESATELVLLGTLNNATATSVNLTLSHLDSNKTLYWKVVPVNVNAESDCSVTNMFTTGQLPISYCVVSTDNGYEYIDAVSFNGVTVDTEYDESGYNFYETPITTVQAGQTYPFTVSVVDADNWDSLVAWFDWNNDGDFADEGEKVVVSANFTTSGVKPANVVVPANASGNVRMRVILAYQVTPDDLADGCVSPDYGDIHDFVITVGTASVAQLDKTSISVFPNPANDIINVASANVIDSVIITDMNGRVVKNVVLGTESSQINISDLSNGVYILNAKSNGASTTQKVVKQ